jgi:hypothetical protein
MRAATREKKIRIMAGAGLVAILFFIWLGQAAGGEWLFVGGPKTYMHNRAV